MTGEKIAVIIIFYNPTTEDILHVKSIANNFNGVIVDNSENAYTSDNKIGNMHYVCNKTNKGIAEAQNIGINIMMNEDMDYFVFLDQDSRTTIEYPKEITNAFISAKRDFPNLALLGPRVLRKKNGEEYKSIIHKDNLSNTNFIQRRDVISSGCCISYEALKTVGLNDVSLFIDYVDYEWCWRAASKNLICGISPLVCIYHKVGQKELRFGRQVVIVSKPFRYFYQYRNYLWLLRRKYVPLQWKIATGIKFVLRILYFPFFIREWKEIEKNMFKGIFHGLFK